jgi:hypothetical protein
MSSEGLDRGLKVPIAPSSTRSALPCSNEGLVPAAPSVCRKCKRPYCPACFGYTDVDTCMDLCDVAV